MRTVLCKWSRYWDIKGIKNVWSLNQHILFTIDTCCKSKSYSNNLWWDRRPSNNFIYRLGSLKIKIRKILHSGWKRLTKRTPAHSVPGVYRLTTRIFFVAPSEDFVFCESLCLLLLFSTPHISAEYYCIGARVDLFYFLFHFFFEPKRPFSGSVKIP
jgi:hypothetical protein